MEYHIKGTVIRAMYLAVKMFCKVPFTSLMGTLGCNMSFRYSCLIFLQLGGLGICQGIGMNGPYKGPMGLACWTPVGNTTIEFT